MFEHLKLKTASLGLVTLLGVSACAESSATARSTPEAPKRNPGIAHSVEYYADGSRVIHLRGNTLDGNEAMTFPLDIYQFCDGKDMVEQTLGERGYASGAITRDINYPACTDGILTASDFSSK